MYTAQSGKYSALVWIAIITSGLLMLVVGRNAEYAVSLVASLFFVGIIGTATLTSVGLLADLLRLLHLAS